MRVVHCKREEYTHYIGRPSILGNPFSHRPSKFAAEPPRDGSQLVPRIVIVGSVGAAIAAFEEYAVASPTVMKAIAALPKDAVLGCWCKPGPCHGDVIIHLWKELHETREVSEMKGDVTSENLSPK